MQPNRLKSGHNANLWLMRISHHDCYSNLMIAERSNGEQRATAFHRNKSLRPSEHVSIVGSLRDREVACSASDRQGSNFESCVWRTVSSQSSHHPQEVLLAQFSLYVHKGGLKPDSFHFISFPSMSGRKSPRYAQYPLLNE